MSLKVLRRALWRARPPVLALGGGGARGFAHVGVLQVLDAHRLPVRAIVGTSMGAVVGAMYLTAGSADEVARLWREARDRDLALSATGLSRISDAARREHPLIQVARRIRDRVVISFAVNRATMLDDRALVRAIDFLVPDVRIEDLGTRFVAVATDLESGAEVRLEQGPLRPALYASAAIPGLLPAVEIERRQLVDGGVVAEVPVAAAAAIGWPVVAVDVSVELQPLNSGDLVLDTMMRAQSMTAARLRHRQLEPFRHVIQPRVGDAGWADWDRLDELIAAGRAAAAEWLGVTPPEGTNLTAPDTGAPPPAPASEPELA